MKNKLNKIANIPQIKQGTKNVSDILKTLKEQQRLEDKKINVSLEFFNRNNEMFNLGSAEKDWYLSFLDAITLLTKITKKELFNEYRNKFKPHPYQENQVNYKDDFLLNPQIESYQLRINKGNGRIHGFFVENTYYIKYLDNAHNMYNSDGYGGVQYFEYPKNEFEQLQENFNSIQAVCDKYKEENKVLLESLDKSFSLVCEHCAECSTSTILYKNLNYK